MVFRQLIMCVALSVATPGLASDELDVGDHISVELNAHKTTESACTLTFMLINGHAAQIDKLVYETVLFDAGGQVDRLTLFDFGTLPHGRPRVRQFSVPGVTCEGLGKVLINGASTCDGADLPIGACEANLTLSTRTEIEVQG